MNEDQIIDLGQKPHELFLNDEAREGLKMAASWSLVLVILGFIGLGLVVLAAIVMIVMAAFLGSASSAMPFPVGLVSIFYLAIAALYYFPVMYLFRFRNKMNEALLHNNVESLAESCTNLGKHYKFVGIMVLVVLSLYLIVFIGIMGMGLSLMGQG